MIIINNCQHNPNFVVEMQSSPELICMDCNDAFKSASLLLQHFAEHVLKHHMDSNTTSSKTEERKKKPKIPNLYPINKKSRISTNETDRGSDSGIEDLNPLKFCLVTMEETNAYSQKNLTDMSKVSKTCKSSTLKKYQCTYCLKRFGWSTDLKRHTLIHTGERPFRCSHCNSSFTRNFLLQNHQRKLHFSDVSKTKLPELKPIGELINRKIKKNRKQQKFKIRRKMPTIDEHQSNYIKSEINRLLCSS